MAENSPLFPSVGSSQRSRCTALWSHPEEMATEDGRHRKDNQPDLEIFKQVGFPVTETVGDYGRKKWSIDTSKCQPGLAFNFDEAIALYLGRHLLEPLAGTPFWRAAQTAFKKIRASLGTGALQYVEKFSTMFLQTMVGASDYSKKAEIIDDLMVGIEDRRAVFITYQSLKATEPTTYDVHPYGITYHRGSLYLIGRSPDHDEIRHWKVDRIEEGPFGRNPLPTPRRLRPSRTPCKSFGVFQGDGDVHVTIRFSATVPATCKSPTGTPARSSRLKRTAALLPEFDLDGTEEIKRWVMSFGRHAEVLGPEGLRGELREEALVLSGIYPASSRRLQVPGPRDDQPRTNSPGIPKGGTDDRRHQSYQPTACFLRAQQE